MEALVVPGCFSTFSAALPILAVVEERAHHSQGLACRAPAELAVAAPADGPIFLPAQDTRIRVAAVVVAITMSMARRVDPASSSYVIQRLVLHA